MTAGGLESILQTLLGLPPVWLYLFLGLGAAAENVAPPVPADTFVLLGGFLAAQGRASLAGVFLSTWVFNCAGSFTMYALARRYGRGVFDTRAGRFLLRPRQLAKLDALYAAHGEIIIFVSRFVPGFRALVPVFAGITRLGAGRALAPIAVASAIWYGALIAIGTLLGRNWEWVLRTVGSVNRALVVAALLLAALVAWAWWRTRRPARDESDAERGEEVEP